MGLFPRLHKEKKHKLVWWLAYYCHHQSHHSKKLFVLFFAPHISSTSPCNIREMFSGVQSVHTSTFFGAKQVEDERDTETTWPLFWIWDEKLNFEGDRVRDRLAGLRGIPWSCRHMTERGSRAYSCRRRLPSTYRKCRRIRNGFRVEFFCGGTSKSNVKSYHDSDLPLIISEDDLKPVKHLRVYPRWTASSTFVKSSATFFLT